MQCIRLAWMNAPLPFLRAGVAKSRVARPGSKGAGGRRGCWWARGVSRRKRRGRAARVQAGKRRGQRVLEGERGAPGAGGRRGCGRARGAPGGPREDGSFTPRRVRRQRGGRGGGGGAFAVAVLEDEKLL